MKTYLIHHTPTSANQDTWAVSFSLPYIASSYARAGDGVWYVKTWLTADQIRRRLAVLFDDNDELHIHGLSRGEANLNTRLNWLEGRLEIDDTQDFGHRPSAVWDAIQNALQAVVPSIATAAHAVTASSARNSRAA